MNQLTAHERATLEAIATTLLPSNGTPGAADTPLMEVVASFVAPQTPQQSGLLQLVLAQVDEVARALAGHVLARLPPAERDRVVRHLAETPALAPAWLLVRATIVLCFYSIPAAYESIGLPGPSIDRGGLPACSLSLREGIDTSTSEQ